jgi:hypothetical protein
MAPQNSPETTTTPQKDIAKNNPSGKKKIFITGLVCHHNEHVEEFISYWLLRKFGSRRFENLHNVFKNFLIDHVDADNYIGEDALTGDALLEDEGKLAIGIGGGMFDEHPSVESGRKENECSATLVAKYLGVADKPELRMILNYAKTNDLQGQSSLLDLACMIRLRQDKGWEFKKIFSRVMEDLDLIYAEQYEFHVTIGNEAKAKTITHHVECGGRLISIAAIKTDVEKVDRYLRSKFGGEYGIIITMNSKGNTQIFSNKKARITFEHVVPVLREREYIITKNRPVPEVDLASIGKEGTQVVDNWFWQKAGDMILNGSRSAKGKTPTLIPFLEIIQIIKDHVAPRPKTVEVIEK